VTHRYHNTEDKHRKWDGVSKEDSAGTDSYLERLGKITKKLAVRTVCHRAGILTWS